MEIKTAGSLLTEGSNAHALSNCREMLQGVLWAMRKGVPPSFFELKTQYLLTPTWGTR